MPKKIAPRFSLYVAHQMLGIYDGHPFVIDQSTNARMDPCCIEDKITIYQRQVAGWFLDPADRILAELKEQASFVVLGICLSYLEGVQQYREGTSSQRKSKEFFRNSFRRVFDCCGLSVSQVEIIYDDMRCGLFHDGMTRSRVIYDMGQERAFAVRNNGSQELIGFHPEHVLDGIKGDFEQYIEELKASDNEEARKRFNDMFIIA